jgi:hypothetical protein
MTGIGITTRMKLVIGCVVVALMTVACGGGNSGSGSGGGAGSSSSSSSGSSESATNPRTEGSGAEAPGKVAAGGSVNVATLPVGGSGIADGHECVHISWTRGDIVAGATVKVTTVSFSRKGFVQVAGKCPGKNCDPSFVFKAGQDTCDLTVRATITEGETATVVITGTAQCVEAQRKWCVELSNAKLFSQASVTHLAEPEGLKASPPTDNNTPSPATPSTPTTSSS